MTSREFFDLVVIARTEAKAYMADKDISHIAIFRDAIGKIDDEILRVQTILNKKGE